MRKRLLYVLVLMGLLLTLAIPVGTLSFTPTVLSITTTSPLPDGEVGAAYAHNLAATGGTTPYHWTGPPLPAGLSLNSASGAITGTPTTAASATAFTFTVTDNSSAQDTKGLFLTILAPPSITTNSTLPNGTVGVTYSKPLEATDGTQPYAWLVQSGTLPAGLNLNLAGGIWGIRGSPDAAGGPFSFTVKVIDAVGVSATKIMAITIDAAAPTVTTEAVSNITTTTATVSGNVTSDGGSPITQRGIVWNTTGNPIITIDSLAPDGSLTTGSYSVPMTGLTAGTPYHVRAYATNAIDTSYGSEVTFTTGIDTATGAGIALFSTTAGIIENLTAVPATGPFPGNMSAADFPYGLFGFRITGLSSGQTVTVTIKLPPNPSSPQLNEYWKYQPGTPSGNPPGWTQLINATSSDNLVITGNPANGYTITFNLTEESTLDADTDLTTITDPGGPAVPKFVGGEVIQINRLAVIAPWLVLVFGLIIGVTILVSSRRKGINLRQ